ncbi:energy transducer TonB [Chitinimonas lacunae]|uniref:Energy transducer TonB n=1 Tax=Chitinimonas lacunae TaxID=1963018 RepID=A0ABV8MVB0_9NEIS
MVDPRWRFGLTLAGSVLLHGLILAWPVKPLAPAAVTPGLSVRLQLPSPRTTAAATPILTGSGIDKVAAASEAAPPPPEPVGAEARPGEQEGADATIEIKPSLPQWLADLAPSADPTYYGAADVDVRAMPRGEIEVEFPGDLPQPNASGRVMLEVLIDEYGVVDEVTVLSALPPGVFEAYAIQSFRRARFSPAIKNGRFVKSRKEIDVCYGDCDSVAPVGTILQVDGLDVKKDAKSLQDNKPGNQINKQ